MSLHSVWPRLWVCPFKVDKPTQCLLQLCGRIVVLSLCPPNDTGRKEVEKRRRWNRWLLLQSAFYTNTFIADDSTWCKVRACERTWSVHRGLNQCRQALSTKWIIHNANSNKNEQRKRASIPAFPVLVSSVTDITENVMLTSQRVLTGWFAGNVVNFGYFPCNWGKLEPPPLPPLKKKKKKRRKK